MIYQFLRCFSFWNTFCSFTIFIPHAVSIFETFQSLAIDIVDTLKFCRINFMIMQWHMSVWGTATGGKNALPLIYDIVYIQYISHKSIGCCLVIVSYHVILGNNVSASNVNHMYNYKHIQLCWYCCNFSGNVYHT